MIFLAQIAPIIKDQLDMMKKSIRGLLMKLKEVFYANILL